MSIQPRSLFKKGHALREFSGKLLVASPHLTDPNFFRTVVLVLRHEGEGAFGIVLNRPSAVLVADAVEEVTQRRPATDDFLYWGGPVDGPLTALHLDADLSEFCVDDVFYGTTDQDHLTIILEHPQEVSRYFAGYSGWGAGQLEDEFRSGSWLLTTPKYEDLFGETDLLWEDVLRRVGRDILGGILPDRDFDPTVN